LASPAWFGVEDGDHRAREGVVSVDLEAWVIQGFAGLAVVAGHGQDSTRMLGW
jgi:hypothetical protein